MTTKTLTKPTQPKKTSIAVSPDLWHALKVRALEERRTVLSIMEALIQGYLTRPLKKGGK